MSGGDNFKFCGKIYTSNAGLGSQDYWVVSGTKSTISEPNTPRNMENRGEGCNSVVYWVTDNLLHEWSQLPDVRPEHIEASRMMKSVLTGNLNAAVNC